MDASNKPKPEQDEKGRFVAGNSGNGGRPKGARAILGEAFLKALQDDFEAHGAEAIVECRTTKPDSYVRTIAGLLPSEMNLNVNRNDDLNDDDLRAKVAELVSQLAPLVTGGIGNTAPSGDIEAGKANTPRVH